MTAVGQIVGGCGLESFKDESPKHAEPFVLACSHLLEHRLAREMIRLLYLSETIPDAE